MPTAGATADRPLEAADVGRIVSDHYDRLYGVAYRILGCGAEAEDVVQDVCLSLPDKLAEFRGEAALTSWLFRVATNRAIDAYRSRRRRQASMTAWGELEALRRAEAAGEAATRDLLDQMMEALDPEDRATVALVVSEGMTHAEAADLMGVATGTIAWRMNRIKEQLRALNRQEVA